MHVCVGAPCALGGLLPMLRHAELSWGYRPRSLHAARSVVPASAKGSKIGAAELKEEALVAINALLAARAEADRYAHDAHVEAGECRR